MLEVEIEHADSVALMALYQRDEYAEKHSMGPGWWFGLRWIVATVLGSMIGRALGDGLSRLELDGIFGILVLSILVGVAAGLCVGVAQALVLYRYLASEGALGWIGATILGRVVRVVLVTLLSWILLSAIPNTAPGVLFLAILLAYFVMMAIIGAVAGAAVGYFQRFVLERRVAHAHRWVWVNIGASVLTFIALASLNYVSVQTDALHYGSRVASTITVYPELSTDLAFHVLNDIVVGAITGYVMIDMLRHPTSQAEWTVDLKEEQNPLVEDDGETQPSPEALLEQRRGE